MPEIRRIIVKLLGSMAFSPSANLQSTELEANAKRAKTVAAIIFIGFMFKK